jgi:hypothetical protein
MAGDGEGKQDVLNLCAGTDVMNDERSIVCIAIGDEADMRQSARKPPGHDITRPVGFRLRRDGQGLSATGEEHRKIRHPPMIDVRIRTGQTPIARIG